MIRDNKGAASRWLGRRIAGVCGGGGDPVPKPAHEIRAAPSGVSRTGRDYNYAIRREPDDK